MGILNSYAERFGSFHGRPSNCCVRASSDRIIRICSFCKKIAAAADEWIDTERAIERMALFSDNALPRLSHGVCPACHAAALAEVKSGAAQRDSL